MSEHEFWKDLGNIFDAVLNYQKKNVEFNNRFINPWIRLGNVFDHEDQANTAVEAYKRATELDPDSAQNWAELGDAQFKKGAYDEAVEAYQKSVALDPEAGWPVGNLALTMVTQGKVEEAIPLYLNSIELLTERKDKAICWNRLGNAYRKLNDYENAFFAFQQADQLDGDNTGFNDKLDEVQANESVIAPEEILEQMIVEQSLEEAKAESAIAPEASSEPVAQPEVEQPTLVETAEGLIALAPNMEMKVEEIASAGDETSVAPVEASMETPVSENVSEEEPSPLDLHEKNFDVLKVVEEVIAKVEEEFSAREVSDASASLAVEDVVPQADESVAINEPVQAVETVAEINEETAPEVEAVASEAVESDVVVEVITMEVEAVAVATEEVAVEAVAEINEEAAPVAETVVSEAVESDVVVEVVTLEVETVSVAVEETVQAVKTVAEVSEETANVVAAVASETVELDVVSEETSPQTETAAVVVEEVVAVAAEETVQTVEAVAETMEETAPAVEAVASEAIELEAVSEEASQEVEAVAAVTEEAPTLVANQESEEQQSSTDAPRKVPGWLIVTNKVLEKLGLEEKSQLVDETKVEEPAQVEAVMTLSDIPQDVVVSESEASMDVVETYTDLPEANLTEAAISKTADPVEGQNDAMKESDVPSESVNIEEASLLIAEEQVTELAYEEYLKDVIEPIQTLPDHVDAIQGETPLTKVSKNGEVRIAMDTKNAHVWNELGNVYLNAGSCDDAISSYSKAIDLDRHFAWPYSNLAFAYVHKGRFAEAILLYQRSIELFSTDKDKAITWNRLGNVYRRINDYSNAIAAYQTADELDPENTTLSLRTSFGLLGNMQSDSKPAYVA
jgi:tetratricopeptide (TPR) repeat protein